MNLFELSNSRVGHLQRPWIPDELREQTGFAALPLSHHAKRKTEAFGRALIQRFQDRYGIDAVMAANIDYWQDDGIRRACASEGVPYLVLCREHVTQDATVKKYKDRYVDRFGFQFEGDGIAVFGPKTRDTLIRLGICSEEQVFVTGAPRLDVWRDSSRLEREKHFVTLLSYALPGYKADSHFQDLLQNYVRFARRHQDQDDVFVVKCKNASDLKRVQMMLPSDTPGNVELHVMMPLIELFPHSKAIIGFNSLSILEALLADAPIVIPYWGETRRAQDELIVNPADEKHASIFTFAYDWSDIEEILHTAMVDDGTLSEGSASLRSEVLNQYFYFPEDTSSSRLVEEFVTTFV